METFCYIIIFFPKCFRSYPTYEEWKPPDVVKSILNILSSYPTYEEWKLKTLNPYPELDYTGSYPTYEEWKLTLAEYLSLLRP